MSDHVDVIYTEVSIDGTKIEGIDLDSIPIPDGDTGTKETTSLGDGTTMKKGLKLFDPGDCNLAGNKLSGDPGQIALQAAYGDRQEHDFIVNVKDAGEIYSYRGLVTKFNPGAKDNTYRFSSKIVASGKFTLETAFASITSITAGAAAATYSPALASSALPSTANDVVVNVTTDITSSTLTVTAASSSYIGYSIDDGATWTTLTSGAASSAITLGAAGTLTKVKVKVFETDKANRYLNVFFARA